MNAASMHLETMSLLAPRDMIKGVDSTLPINMLPSSAGRLIMFTSIFQSLSHHGLANQ